MLGKRGKGLKRNQRNVSEKRPTKTPRIDGDEEVQAQDKIPGHGQGQPIPSSSLPTYVKIEDIGSGKSTISMDFEGETGQALKESLIKSIRSCLTDLKLICSDGVAYAHRIILMGVSDFLFQLLRDRDPKDTKAITVADVSVVHLQLALALIYNGATSVNESDENGVHEVLDLLGIHVKLERKKVTEVDLAMSETLDQEVPSDDDDNNMQIVEEIEEENGETSGNEVETTNASKNNASTVEKVDGIDEAFSTATENGTEITGMVEANAYHEAYRSGAYSQTEEAGPGQLDLREPYLPTEDHIIWCGRKIPWHLMEALPSLTSPELRAERMRVFTLNIFNRSRSTLYADIGHLFQSLPENSLEKRLGMMAVQCENYKEIDLVQLLQRDPDCNDKSLQIEDVKLLGSPSQSANLVTTMFFNTHLSASKAVVALTRECEMLKNDSDRYNLENYKKIIYGNVPIEDRLLEIGNIKGLEGRARAIIKMNVAGAGGRTVFIKSGLGQHFGRQEYFEKANADSFDLEIGGVGWDVWKYSWESKVFDFKVTDTQILFPMLVKDVDLAKKVVIEQASDGRLAVSPKYLLENGISCFPVVQKPGMLIYRHNYKDDNQLDWTLDISKLRLDMGAEIWL